MNKNNSIVIGAILDSKSYGKFKVLDIINSRNIKVEFLNTRYVTTSKKSNISMGAIKDRLARTVYGVGFNGGERGSFCDKVAYKHWHGAMQRCYDDKYLKRKPTYRGCSVATEWHNFQNFFAWHKENYPNDGAEYQLDKDLKIIGNKVYGPDACSYVTHEENMQSHAKTYKIKSPEGVIVDITNLSKFCLKNGLDTSNVLKVINGVKPVCKGWSAV